jgi:hypothetical protein
VNHSSRDFHRPEGRHSRPSWDDPPPGNDDDDDTHDGNGHDDASPFANDQVQMVWDAVRKADPRIFNHVTGEQPDPDISLTDYVRAFYEAARPFAVFSDQIADALAWHPNAPDAKRAKANPTLFRDDVRKIWDECHAAANEQNKEQAECAQLAQAIAFNTLIQRNLPPPDRILGDLITTTTRLFLVGRTGFGKTQIGMAVAAACALGIPFCHWTAHRAARVVIIDGEMSLQLLKQRSLDLAARIGLSDIPNLGLFSKEDAEKLAARFSRLGMLEPLNTDAGIAFVQRLVAMLKPDLIFFDNVQALLVGPQADEQTWAPTNELVRWLTQHHVGQVWIDHTGHDSTRQFGTSTKAWSFDSVGIMTPLPEDQRKPMETAFTISFDHPGKARCRTPQNWSEFAPHILRMRDDGWTSEPTEPTANAKKKPEPSPSRRKFYDSLVSAIGKDTSSRSGRTTLDQWQAECVRQGLIEPPPPDGNEKYRQKASRTASWRSAKSDLILASWIACDNQTVTDTKGRW